MAAEVIMFKPARTPTIERCTTDPIGILRCLNVLREEAKSVGLVEAAELMEVVALSIEQAINDGRV